MKKILLYTLICFTVNILFSSSAFSQLFRSVASGNWNATSTWEMSTNNGSTWIAATSTPTDASGSITVRIPNTVTVSVNVNADQLTIDSGGVLSINSSVILTLLNGAGDDLTLSPGGTVSGSGTFRTQGAGNVMNIRAGSFFNASLNVNTGNTLIYNSASPTVARIYGSVTVDAGATLNGGNVSGRQLYIYGSIINNGTLTVTSTGSSMRLYGSLLANSGTVNHSGALFFDSVTTLSGSGTFTPANTTINGNITLGSNITYSPSASITIANGAVLNPNGNTFTLTSGTMFVNGTGTISAPGTVRTQNTVSLYTDPTSQFYASLNVNTGTTLATEDNSPYEGKIYGNVTIDAGATLNGGNISGRDLFIYGNVVNNGILTVSSTGATMRIYGSSFTNSGSVNHTGTLYFDSVTTLSGAGTFTPANTTINGNLTLGSNITYSPGSIFEISNGAALNPNGNIFTLTSGTMDVNGTGIISAPGTIRTQNSVNIYCEPLTQFKASLNVNTGTTLAYDNNSPYIGRIYGNVTIDNGATLNGGNITGRNLFLYGSVINNGTLTASSSGAVLRIKGTSLINNGLINHNGSFFFDTTTAFSGTGSFTSLANFSTNANVTLNSTHQMNSININTGATFNISNRLLKLTASNPITQNGTFTTIGSKVEYNGSVLQLVSATNINYSGLIINNPAGASLSGNITITDTLAVILGDLNLNTRIITLTPTAYMTETPGNTVYGISGYITTTRSINAPSGLNVAGMGAVLTTSTNLGSTEIRRGHTVQTGLNGGTSIQRYFDITPAVNTGLNATLVFKYDESELNGKPEPSLKLFKSTNSGSTWTSEGGKVNVNLNQITLTGISSFSRWSADTSQVSASIGLIMEGFYNAATNRLNSSDTVRAYFRNTVYPYTIVDSAAGVVNYITLKAGFQFNNSPSGTYYLQIKHRNSIETWSSTGLAYDTTKTLNYDFTTSPSMAYGSNQVKVDNSPVKYAIYSGDVNQDGTVDASDLSEVENASSESLSGYVVTDVTGDDFVDGSDVSIVENNAANSVSAVTP